MRCTIEKSIRQRNSEMPHAVPKNWRTLALASACVGGTNLFSLFVYPNPYTCFAFNLLSLIFFFKLAKFYFILQNQTSIEHKTFSLILHEPISRQAKQTIK